MRKLEIIALRFFAIIFLLNFLLWLLIKYIAIYSYSMFISSKKDFFSSRNYIHDYFHSINDNFLQFFLNNLIGDWGYSFVYPDSRALDPVRSIVFPAIQITIISYLLVSLISITITYIITRHYFPRDNQNFLRLSRGNWPFLLCVIIIPSFIILRMIRGDNPSIYLYRSSLDQQLIFTTTPYLFHIFVTSILGTAKSLHQLSTTPPEFHDSNFEDLSFPKINNSENEVKKTISPLQITLITYKSSHVTIFEIILITETISTIPGIGHDLWRASLWFDLPVLVASFLLIVVFLLFIRSLLDLLIMEHEMNVINSGIFNHNGPNPLLLKIGKIITVLFVILVVIATSLQNFIPSVLNYIPYLWDPDYSQNEIGHLPIFTGSHILGTDAKGRDIFSRLFFGTSFFLVPLCISILLRPLIVLSVNFISSKTQTEFSFILFDCMESLPKLPVILTLPILIFTTDISVHLLIGLVFSLLFWGNIGKRPLYHLKETNNELSMKNYLPKLVLLSFLSTIIEIILFTYLTKSTVHQPSWGGVMVEAINSQPLNYFSQVLIIFLIPTTFITGMYIYVDNLLLKNDADQNS